MNIVKPLLVGERVRVKSTGQEVTIDQVSDHGFTIIKFNSGGKHRFLNHKLEKLEDNKSVMYS
ncbi:MAG: hypothetical protein OQL06_00505 [Gammaproteobacteria bacterium]|nr:hypothetical protein [Gammaproteobacteria bacterium]